MKQGGGLRSNAYSALQLRKVQEFSSLLVYFFLKGSSLAFPAPVAKLLYSENLEDQKYKEPKENNHL